jgi:hypothetical protein
VILSQEENIYRDFFANCEKSYILTGYFQCSLDFTSHQASVYLVENKFETENRQLPPLSAEENFNFEPSTFSEDSSDPDDPDYPPFEGPHLIGSRKV